MKPSSRRHFIRTAAAAVYGDGDALDMPRLGGAEERNEGGDVFRASQTADALRLHFPNFHLGNRFAGAVRLGLKNLRQTLGYRQAGVDGIDIHVVALASSGKCLRKVRHRRIDRSADHVVRLRRPREPADNADDIPAALGEHRPQQP